MRARGSPLASCEVADNGALLIMSKKVYAAEDDGADSKVYDVQPHSVDGVPDAPPGAPELQRRVHELVRAGKPISEADALAYSLTLTKAQYTNQNKALLGVHRFGGCCWARNFIRAAVCGSDIFLLSGPVLFLPCLPLCCMLRLEDDHRYVQRQECDVEVHSCVIVDHERGTFACFHCCSGFCCYCEKM